MSNGPRIPASGPRGPVERQLLLNAQRALLSGFKPRFGIEPETDDIITATENAARLVNGGEGGKPDWELVDGKRRIVWR
jgi:hypothetical protein